MPKLYVHLPVRVEKEFEFKSGGFDGFGRPFRGLHGPRAIHPYKRLTHVGIGSSIGAHEIPSPLQHTLWPTIACVNFTRIDDVAAALDELKSQVFVHWNVSVPQSTEWRRCVTPQTGKPPHPGMYLDGDNHLVDYGTNANAEYVQTVPGDMAWPGCLEAGPADSATWSTVIPPVAAPTANPDEARIDAECVEYASTALCNLWLLTQSIVPKVIRPQFDELRHAWLLVDNFTTLVETVFQASVRNLNKKARDYGATTPPRPNIIGAGTQMIRYVAIEFESIQRLAGTLTRESDALGEIGAMRELVRNPGSHKPWALNKTWPEFGSVDYMPGTPAVISATQHAFRLAKDVVDKLNWFPTTGLQ